MSNNFPVVPAFSLASVTYTAIIENTGQNWPSGGFSYSGVTVENVQFATSQEQTGIFSITFVFTTPGNPGSFDQGAAEAQIVVVLNDLAQAVAVTAGAPLAAVQSMTTVYRLWTWTDATGAYTLTHTDTMTYPPPSS